MTPERAKQLLPIITAFANGEHIQARHKSPGAEWVSFIHNPIWDDDTDYRVKPRPREWWIRWPHEGSPPQVWDQNPISSGACHEIVHVREVIE